MTDNRHVKNQRKAALLLRPAETLTMRFFTVEDSCADTPKSASLALPSRDRRMLPALRSLLCGVFVRTRQGGPGIVGGPDA